MTTKVPKKTAKRAGESIVKRLKRLLADEEALLALETEPGRRTTAARNVLMFISELRKAEAAASRRIEKVTRPLVIAWLRHADAEERRSVAREIAAMEQEGSILA